MKKMKKMKIKQVFKLSLFLWVVLLLLCSFSPKKEIPQIINFNERFVQIDSRLCVDKYEVTVSDFQLFLGEKKEISKDYELLMYDSTAWMRSLTATEDFTSFYFNNEYFTNNPIVCISHYAANEFCKWLTEKYNTGLQKKYKTVVFRLPLESEYKKVAISHYDPSKIWYPWGNNSLYSKGEKCCNFRELDQAGLDYNYINNQINYHESGLPSCIAPVDFYLPNPYGVYNIVGNASEMIQEDHVAMGGDWFSTGFNVKINSKKAYDVCSPTVGFRVYMEIVEN